MKHTCAGKLTIIGSDNALSPGRRQAIIWTNAWILLIVPLGTNISEIIIAIETFSFTKMHLKISSAKWRPFCLGLNVLMVRMGLCWYDTWQTLTMQSNLSRNCLESHWKWVWGEGVSHVSIYHYVMIKPCAREMSNDISNCWSHKLVSYDAN